MEQKHVKSILFRVWITSIVCICVFFAYENQSFFSRTRYKALMVREQTLSSEKEAAYLKKTGMSSTEWWQKNTPEDCIGEDMAFQCHPYTRMPPNFYTWEEYKELGKHADDASKAVWFEEITEILFEVLKWVLASTFLLLFLIPWVIFGTKKSVSSSN